MNRLFTFLAALAIGLVVARTSAQEMFPFVIPGLAASPAGSIVDVSWLNDPPAGGRGFVRVRDGHFVDGRGKRIRFLASNFAFASCFPDHDTADKLAARLASLGINCVRFHHMDNQTAPRGIWKAGAKKNELDPGQLDRLDYFIAALKRHGIYANINLHVSRNYWEGEDFPDGLESDRERQEKLPHYGKSIDKINDQMVRMQRDYARALLTHVSPYTRTAYAKEPCVAIVEINNENSLLQLKVSSLPEYYRSDVLDKWNRWLKARYGSSEKLSAAWGGREAVGTNLLPARLATQGGQYFTVTNGSSGETRISLLDVPTVSWHAQLHWPGLTLEAGKLYTLEFSGRSDLPRNLPISTRFTKPDWHNCGLVEEAELGPRWETFSYTFRADSVEPGAVRFDMVVGGGPVGDFWLRNLTLRSGGSLGLRAGESLENGKVDAPTRTQASPRGIAWTRFLAETERAYTDGMRRFLKEDLGVEAAIIDTQASYGGVAGTYRESFNDFIDMHAYWQHPHFPGRPWDGGNWTISNTPMVDDQSGGNLSRLCVYRVAGKPFTVSEYDHPAPSHYAAEMFPMVASFAAFQDWDGLFQFDWGGTEPDSRRIGGYFALQQHPAKLAFLPAAALMFRRGDVEAARATARLAIPAAQVQELTADGVSIGDAWRQAGVTASDMFNRRLEIQFTQHGKAGRSRRERPTRFEAKVEKAAASPLVWNTETKVYTVDASATKAVVGRCTGRLTTLNGTEFDVKANSNNFAALTLSAVDGKALMRSHRLLLAAVGNVENTGMGWNADHTSVGTRWGSAPTVCEGIAAKITIATSGKNALVHALDGSGARLGEVPATLVGGKLSFEIGPRFRTLWYEIAVE